jgi:hypothetical protein
MPPGLCPTQKEPSMTEHDLKTIEMDCELSLEELEAVAGGDQVAHLPQSIHMERLSINENPTRYA